MTDSLNRFAIMKRYVSGQDVLRQSELDVVFHPLQSKTSDLAGLDLFTLQRVLELFTHAHVEQSAATIGEYLGVSKSTARRYLDKAVEQGELEAFLAHGKVGRPTRFYRTKRSW
ncbi:helix-turn-helix domain-containing protein [Vibrio cidicii]|uniref:helix-turn-helix domain-containing protein n=1 Tax=Vibrio cidicii TaxID=1763883 RepID=UPI00375364F8